MKTRTKPKSGPRHAGGRPRKFQEPSRPITVTLPERTLRQLAAMDADRAQAITRAVALATGPNADREAGVEIIRVAPRLGMLMVPASRYLREMPELRLLEISPSRFLLSLPPGTSPAALEVALLDKMEEVPQSNPQELAILQALHQHCRRFRRTELITRAEVLFLHLDGTDG